MYDYDNIDIEYGIVLPFSKRSLDTELKVLKTPKVWLNCG